MRDIRDYTLRIDLNDSDHTIEIAQPAGAELAEILTRLHELISRELGAGSTGVTPAAKHTSDGQQPVINNSSPSPEAGTTGAEARAGEANQATPTPTQTAGSRRLEITPAVTRSKSSPENLQVMLSDGIPHIMQKLALCTKEAMPDMAHHIKMLTYAEYAYAITNVKLKSRSEGEKVVEILNTFKEAIGLPEAVL